MQIIDGFEKDHLKVTLILKRNQMKWNVDDNEYIRTYLKSLITFANDKKTARGVYTLYDLCMDLYIEPKPIYAYIGWKDDKIVVDPFIDDKKVMFGLECKFL